MNSQNYKRKRKTDKFANLFFYSVILFIHRLWTFKATKRGLVVRDLDSMYEGRDSNLITIDVLKKDYGHLKERVTQNIW